jgi:hypothetical protein
MAPRHGYVSRDYEISLVTLGIHNFVTRPEHDDDGSLALLVYQKAAGVAVLPHLRDRSEPQPASSTRRGAAHRAARGL